MAHLLLLECRSVDRRPCRLYAVDRCSARPDDGRVADELEAAFGQVVRQLREAKGMSQEELSFACGRHRTYISLIERGKNSPSMRTLWMLAEALGVRPDELVRVTIDRLGA